MPRPGSVEEIQKAGERAAALTRQLLAFSRRQVLEPVVLSVNELIRNLEKMLARLVGEDLNLVTRMAVGQRPGGRRPARAGDHESGRQRPRCHAAREAG